MTRQQAEKIYWSIRRKRQRLIEQEGYDGPLPVPPSIEELMAKPVRQKRVFKLAVPRYYGL